MTCNYKGTIDNKKYILDVAPRGNCSYYDIPSNKKWQRMTISDGRGYSSDLPNCTHITIYAPQKVFFSTELKNRAKNLDLMLPPIDCKWKIKLMAMKNKERADEKCKVSLLREESIKTSGLQHWCSSDSKPINGASYIRPWNILLFGLFLLYV